METVVQGQQRVFAEGDDDRLFLDAQHRRMNILRPGRQILDRCSLLPLGHGLLVDPVALRQRSQALFTMLYCSTEGRSEESRVGKACVSTFSFRWAPYH